MRRTLPPRAALAVTAAVGALVLTSACTGDPGTSSSSHRESKSEAEREAEEAREAGLKPMPANAVAKYLMIAGTDPDEAAKESREAATLAEQYAQARTAPGIVAPGAYSDAFATMTSMASTGGAWTDVTRLPYDSDDPRYRDYYSNSSGGMGFVNGRITGLAADNSNHVYAASADGGVWRSSTGGGRWVPIADALPTLSSGDLTLSGADGSLWYATGEANTGGTSYVGSGVYRLANPTSGTFTPANRVGGKELESTTIMKIRFSGGRVWASTNRGVWWHEDTTSAGPWHFAFAPNMDWMPEIRDDAGNLLVPKGANWTGNTASGPTPAAYKNIVNDIAVDPRNAQHVVAAIGWRSGDTYNGFYESRDGGRTWTKIKPSGAIPADDIGYVTFAWAADGSKLYAINQSPRLLNKPTGTVNSYLDGFYVSNNGSISGPWSKIADSTKLASSGSALKQSVIGKGYGPGIQAWYNQFMVVDPQNPNHVYAGLEEIYETKDAGATWRTVGPYWNFYFSCWNIDDAANTCPKTTHPDQHAAAIGTVNGVPTFFGGNDGGVYSRPVNGKVNGAGHATDWKSLTRDGTMDGLQYYSVAWGADTRNVGTQVISGGLQDNGASNLFGVSKTGASVERTMGSHFGGDGGDSMADPANGCRQVHEYVTLSMRVTENCAVNKGALTLQEATSWSIKPADPAPRFIAPFGYDHNDPSKWIAAGQYVWRSDKGYAMRSGSEWTKAYDLGAGHSATSVAMANGVAYVGWCGPCNNSGFTRGVATNAGGTWHQLTLPKDGVVPNRFVGGVEVDKANPNHAFLAMNGFSRRFTEGPGAGVGHVFETTDGGTTWTDVSANLPDVPTSSVKLTPTGAVLLGSDLGAFYRAPGSTAWTRLGTGLPVATVMDIELAGDGNVYVATHGRGIWSVTLP